MTLYCMRYQHFPLFAHGHSKDQSECLALEKQGSFIEGVSTAPSLAIGYTYRRGARYLYEGRALLTEWPLKHLTKIGLKRQVTLQKRN